MSGQVAKGLMLSFSCPGSSLAEVSSKNFGLKQRKKVINQI